jgi:hypothetical protein
MKRTLVSLIAFSFVVAGASSAIAENPVKKGGEDVVNGTKTGIRDTEKGVKKVGSETEKGVKAVGTGTKKVVTGVGHGLKKPFVKKPKAAAPTNP